MSTDYYDDPNEDAFCNVAMKRGAHYSPDFRLYYLFAGIYRNLNWVWVFMNAVIIKCIKRGDNHERNK